MKLDMVGAMRQCSVGRGEGGVTGEPQPVSARLFAMTVRGRVPTVRHDVERALTSPPCERELPGRAISRFLFGSRPSTPAGRQDASPLLPARAKPPSSLPYYSVCSYPVLRLPGAHAPARQLHLSPPHPCPRHAKRRQGVVERREVHSAGQHGLRACARGGRGVSSTPTHASVRAHPPLAVGPPCTRSPHLAVPPSPPLAPASTWPASTARRTARCPSST